LKKKLLPVVAAVTVVGGVTTMAVKCLTSVLAVNEFVQTVLAVRHEQYEHASY
jgi:hypothetical protein